MCNTQPVAATEFHIEDIIGRKKASGQYNNFRDPDGYQISEDTFSSWKSTVFSRSMTLNNKQRPLLSNNLNSYNFPYTATLQTAECEGFDRKIPRKFLLQRAGVNRLKSRSDSDLYLSDVYRNAARYDKDSFEVSSFPSDSDITVIRVLERSGVQRTASRTTEFVLGDGFHLPESSSMINLATLIQGIPLSSGTQECLIPLSSWDSPAGNRTTSDTIVQSASACYWGHRANPTKLIANDQSSTRKIVTTKLTNLDHKIKVSVETLKTNFYDELMILNQRPITAIPDVDSNDEDLTFTAVNKFVDADTIICTDVDDAIEIIEDSSVITSCRRENLFVRFSARVQKTLLRVWQCFCFPVRRRDEGKLGKLPRQ